MSNTTNSFKPYQNIRHSTIQAFIRCPKCLIDSKNPRRVKTHKNLSSLDFHFSTAHKGEFWVTEARILIRQFAEVLIK